MSLPIDTFRIINQYMPFIDKYTVYTLSEELGQITVEDISMSLDDIIELFNNGDMNQIKFAMKYCRDDIDFKLHECIDRIRNVNSIEFIITDVIDDVYNGIVRYNSLALENDYPVCKDQYDRDSNVLAYIIDKVSKDISYYPILKYVSKLDIDIDFDEIFESFDGGSKHQEFIIGLLEYNCDIEMSREIAKELLNFNDENFEILIDRFKVLFKSISLPILLDYLNYTTIERFNKVIKFTYESDIMGSLPYYIDEMSLETISLILDHLVNLEDSKNCYKLFIRQTIFKLLKLNDIEKLEVFTSYINIECKNPSFMNIYSSIDVFEYMQFQKLPDEKKQLIKF
ncbi:hypothetical protein D3C87_1039170 [compost metagenome]